MATRKAITLVSGLFQEVNTPTDKLDFAGNTTADLTENTNLYYTDARSRAAVSVTDSGGFGSLSYNNTTGVITLSELDWVANNQSQFSRLDMAIVLKIGRLMDEGIIELDCRLPV